MGCHSGGFLDSFLVMRIEVDGWVGVMYFAEKWVFTAVTKCFYLGGLV